MKKQVWRVEDAKGNGMYCRDVDCSLPSLWSRTVGTFEDYGCDDFDRHPCPEHDGIDHFPSYYRFGFKDIDQMMSWIHKPEWREAMSEEGGRLRCYEVDEEDIIYGFSQVVFDFRKAKFVSSQRVDVFDIHHEVV